VAEAKKGLKWGASSGHTTKLEQSRFSLDIYACEGQTKHSSLLLAATVTKKKVFITDDRARTAFMSIAMGPFVNTRTLHNRTNI
jgi:hypothetical protein